MDEAHDACVRVLAGVSYDLRVVDSFNAQGLGNIANPAVFGEHGLSDFTWDQIELASAAVQSAAANQPKYADLAGAVRRLAASDREGSGVTAVMSRAPRVIEECQKAGVIDTDARVLCDLGTTETPDFCPAD